MSLQTTFFLSCLFLFLPTFSQSPGDCPPYQAFGDSSVTSFLELADEGRTTRIYFAALAAQQVDSAAYQLLLPRFGESTLALSELDLYLSYDDIWERWELSLPRRRVARIECANYPDALRNFSGAVPDSLLVSDGQIFIEHIGGSQAEGSYFHLRLAIDQIAPMSVEAPQVVGTYLPDSAQEMVAVQFAEATYAPTEQKLTLQYGTVEGYQNVSLYDVSPGPGRYEKINDYFGQYTHRAYVIDTLQPGQVALRVYDFSALKPQGAASEAGFFPDVEIAYPLSVGKLIAELRSTDVTWQPAVPDWVFGRSAPAAPAPPQRAPASEVDFDAGPRPRYQPMVPFDLTYFPTKGGQTGPVGIQEQMAPAPDGWQLALRPASGAADKNDPRITELTRLLTDFNEIQELRGPEDYAEALAKVQQINQTYELGLAQPYPTEIAPLRERLVQAITSQYPKDLLQQVAEAQKQQAEGSQLGESLPITVYLDGETGLPQRTQWTTLATDIALRYEAQQVTIVAANAEQGRDSLTVPLPAGSIDLFQFRHQLGYLPLAKDYTATLPVFAVAVQQRRSYASQAGRRETVTLEPLYLRAKLSVQGIERPEGAQEDWYRVQVQWESEPQMLPFFEGQPETYGAAIPVTYWLTRRAPHRLRRVDYGRRRGLEEK